MWYNEIKQKTKGYRMRKLTIAGNSLADVVKMIDFYPAKGMLTNIRSISQGVGGAVPNSGITLKRLDPANIEVEAVSRLGKDAYGQFVKGRLEENGVRTEALKFDASLPTSFSDVMTLPNGERTFFHARGANAAFCEDDIDVAGLKADLFHIGYLLLLDKLDEADEQYGTKMAKLLSHVQARGVKTSIDIVSEETDRFPKVVRPALRYCDYAVINEVEAGRVVGIEVRDAEGALQKDNLRTVCEKFFELGVREKVIVHCPELGCGMDAKGNFTVVPSLHLPKGYIVGSVGAGDAFCAGMLYSFLTDMDTESGLKLASDTAACNLSAPDSIGGARSFEETIALEKQFERRKI